MYKLALMSKPPRWVLQNDKLLSSVL